MYGPGDGSGTKPEAARASVRSEGGYRRGENAAGMSILFS